MAKALKEKSEHRSSEIVDRLKSDPIFWQTTDRMIAEILDTPSCIEDDGSAKGHVLQISRLLLAPHVNNLQISLIDSYKVGNLRNFLIWHNGLRRLLEINIEAVHNDTIVQRMEGFGRRRDRAEEI